MWERVAVTYGIKGQTHGTGDSSALNFFQRTSFTQIWLRQVLLAINFGTATHSATVPKLNQTLSPKTKSRFQKKRLAKFHFTSC